ncbi:MAG: ACT domain-containing protein [Thermoproteus sp.]|jgi:acetolactate synthase II small subunit|nr:MAG: acetolactate synthase [Thermoproteus sp. CIS_19]
MSISVRIPPSMDYVGRVVSIVRRAKVFVRRMEIEARDSTYHIVMDVEGPADEIGWLIAKLDKLPEVLEIGRTQAAPAIAVAVREGR